METESSAQVATQTKRLICLANSRKNNGRCIAGIEIVNHKEPVWIRPVTSSLTGEVLESECIYSLGHPIRVLDILEVRLVGPQPKNYQQENWLIGPGRPWALLGRAKWADVDAGISKSSTLWSDGDSSSSGANDRISDSALSGIHNSLRLIRVEHIELAVIAPYRGKGAPQLRAKFTYAQAAYSLVVTDPRYELSYRSREVGSYQIGPALLTISLGEPYKGHVYKLVAAIIEEDLL